MSELSLVSGASRVHRAYHLLLYAHDFYTKRSRSHDEDALNTQQYSCTFSLDANEQCFALFEDAAKLDTVVACIGPTTGLTFWTLCKHTRCITLAVNLVGTLQKQPPSQNESRVCRITHWSIV
jgi:hypothetical protein